MTLTGTGVVPAHIDVAPTSHNFGEVILGRTASGTLVVRNLGGTDVQITATGLVGDQAADFAVTLGGGPFLLPSGATHNIEVQFGPVSAGPRIATFQIRSATETESVFHVALSGTGITPPEVDVTPTIHQYGEVLVGTMASRAVIIRNLGGAALHVSGTSLIGLDAHDFAVAQGPFVVLPGASHQVDVRFTPTASGPRAATLQLTTDDADEPLIDVALSGVGSLLVRDIAVTPETHGYGSHEVGTSATHTFVIMNTGTANLIVGGATLTGPDADSFTVVNGQDGFAIAPGGSHTDRGSLQPAHGRTQERRLDDPKRRSGREPASGLYFRNHSSDFRRGCTRRFSQFGHGDHRDESCRSHRASVSRGRLTQTVSPGHPGDRSRPDLEPAGRAVCGRSQTGIDLWWARGDAGTGEVTATLASASINTAIAVARYSGLAAIDPLTPLVAGNTNDVNGACTSGTDTSAYTFDVTSTGNNTVVLGVLALRNRTHSPESGFTTVVDVTQGTGGDIAGLTIVHRTVPLASTLSLGGSLNGATDWAVVGVELKPEQ